MLTPLLALSTAAMLLSQPRLAERALADVGAIRLPRGLKEMYKGADEQQAGRITFTFSDAYFWASFGAGMAYKQAVFVSVMAPDATDAEYDEYPRLYRFTYADRKTISKTTVGSGTLTVIEGRYQRNSLDEPSHTFFYVDRARRLQLVWHAVKAEIDLAAGVAAIAPIAASFRITRDPGAKFAAIRDRRRKEADDRVRRRTMAMEMLEREGYGPLTPGKPVLKNAVYVEWMSHPEPRFQLLLPLGPVRSAASAPPISRPRPVRLAGPDGTARRLTGTVGWREFIDGKWELSNDDNDYVPFEGIAALLAANHQDPNMVFFYYSATVRVEEEQDDTRVTNLRWFFDGLPEVRRLWQEGKLVAGGRPRD